MSKRLDVFNEKDEWVATCATAEDAAALISTLDDGSTIRSGDNVLWTEGKEDQAAGESYDFVAELVWDRLDRIETKPVEYQCEHCNRQWTAEAAKILPGGFVVCPECTPRVASYECAHCHTVFISAMNFRNRAVLCPGCEREALSHDRRCVTCSWPMPTGSTGYVCPRCSSTNSNEPTKSDATLLNADALLKHLDVLNTNIENLIIVFGKTADAYFRMHEKGSFSPFPYAQNAILRRSQKS